MVQGKPFWSYRCESCMRCMNQCPKRAIETAHGFAIGLALVLTLLLGGLIYPTIEKVYPALAEGGFLVTALRSIGESALMLTVMGAGYRLLHRAMRFRGVQKLVMATSLTHFRFWRRYKAPPRKERSDTAPPDRSAKS